MLFFFFFLGLLPSSAAARSNRGPPWLGPTPPLPLLLPQGFQPQPPPPLPLLPPLPKTPVPPSPGTTTAAEPSSAEPKSFLLPCHWLLVLLLLGVLLVLLLHPTPLLPLVLHAVCAASD